GHSVRNTHHAQGVCLVEVLPAPSVRVPETPPGHLPLHTTHSGGVFVCERSPPKKLPAQQWRRLDRKAYPQCLEHPPLRSHYFALALVMKPQREVNDETCSKRQRQGGLFDFNRLGGAGEPTAQYQPERLPG